MVGAPHDVPALLTRISIGPSAEMTRSTIGAIVARPAHVADHGQRLDAERTQMLGRRVQLVLLPRGDRDLRSEFTQHLGDLQAQAPRSAGDERDLAAEVLQVGQAHLVVSE